ncbi:murein biosynthesis integral membrane protein MurJ [Schumannella sp. 10F1B-5-1]|uniref:murein biosynthesis integral membrane protein MurJ n=1 Tax=Schumannella sp. 10F1B-5-1 TaxID=2590780 RepID=UPI001132647D|nr:lipid II flippase MurJ [Schumannella sp. 10F1B-5-1]TPW76785.1 murein biosynthesis integral membrane protein MurJ [Schumannella sp. 10F1B-5-1]
MTDPTPGETPIAQPTAADATATAPEARAAASAGAPRASIGRASMMLAGGTLVSRALGFINLGLLSAVIGTVGIGANAFTVANGLPNQIYLLIAGGLLSAVLVPQIVKSALHDDGGQGYVNRLVTLGLTGFLGVTILATVGAPVLVRVFANANGQLAGAGLELATVFAYLCLPQIFFYAMYSLLGEVLNARGVFGPFAWAPIVNNVIAIAGLIVFAVLYGIDPAHRDPATWDAQKILVLGGTTTLGVALQALTLCLFWRRTGLRFRPDFRWRGMGLGATGKIVGWTFGMLLISQGSGIVQNQIATLADSDDASVAAIRVAWTIFVLPHSLIALSIATPYFTRMSAHSRDGDLVSLRSDLSGALRSVGLLIAGAAVVFATAAVPLINVFSHTAPHALPQTSLVLLAYLAGLVPFSALFLVQRAFFALSDTRTPFFIQLLQAAVFTVGALFLIGGPSDRLAVGIALWTSISIVVQLIVSIVVLRRRLGGFDGRRLARRYGVFLLCTIPAGAVGLLMLWVLGGWGVVDGSDWGFAVAGRVESILAAAAIAAAAGIVYVAAVIIARVPEVHELRAPLGRLLRRG